MKTPYAYSRFSILPLSLLLFLFTLQLQDAAGGSSNSKEYTLHSFSDYTGKQRIAFGSSGSAKFSSHLTSTDGQSTFHSLLVSKDAIIKGDLLVNKKMISSASLEATNVHVKNKIHSQFVTVEESITGNELVVKERLRVSGVVNVTSDVSIQGRAHVGSLTLRGSMDAPVVRVGNEMSAKMIKGMNIDIDDKLVVRGFVKATHADFSGTVKVNQKLRANETEVNRIVVLGSNGRGDGDDDDGRDLLVHAPASFTKSVVMTDLVSMLGDVESRNMRVDKLQVNDDLHAERIILGVKDKKDSRTSSSSYHKKARSDIVALHVVEGIIKAGEIVSTNSIHSVNITADVVASKKAIHTPLLVAHENAQMKNISVSDEATIRHIAVTTVDVKDKLQVTDGPIVAHKFIHSMGNCTVDGTLSVNKAHIHWAQLENVTSSTLTSTHVYAGTIASRKIVVNEGAVHCEDLRATKDITAIGGITSESNIHALGGVSSKVVHATESIDAPLISGSRARFGKLNVVDGLEVMNSTMLHGNLTITNGTIRCQHADTKLLKAASVEVEENINARSLIGARIYAEDIAASGFVSAQSIIAKSRVEVNGEMYSSGRVTVKSKLTADDVEVVNGLISPTASFGGLVRAGGLEVKKLRLDGDLVVKGDNIDVLEMKKILDELQQRVRTLEALMEITEGVHIVSD